MCQHILTTARSRQETLVNSRTISRCATTPCLNSFFSAADKIGINRSRSHAFIRERCQRQDDISTQLRNTLSRHKNLTIIGCMKLCYILSQGGITFTTPKTVSRRSSRQTSLRNLSNGGAALRCSHQDFRDAGTSRVILISRQRNGGQNTNNRHDDHQFDEGETFLHCFHDFLLERVVKWIFGIRGGY